MDAGVAFNNVFKRFGDRHAADALSLTVPRGTRMALLGPSGCGKTTCLRMLAGIERPDAGTIRIREQVVNDPARRVPPAKRRVGMVFQSLALWPHMTVRGNVQFAAPDAPADRVSDLLAMVGLSDRQKSYPFDLSGGERQRVALARALVSRPEVLLMDEPMANLDESLKRELIAQVKDLQERFEATMIYVTHDQEEASSIGNLVAVMKDGRILQTGSPAEVYRRPVNEFVALFLGRANIVKGACESGVFRSSFGAFPCEGGADGPATAAFRAEDVTIETSENGPFIVEGSEFVNGRFLVSLSLDGAKLLAQSPVFIHAGEKASVDVNRPLYVLPS